MAMLSSAREALPSAPAAGVSTSDPTTVVDAISIMPPAEEFVTMMMIKWMVDGMV